VNTVNIPVTTHTVALYNKLPAQNPRRHHQQISKYDGRQWVVLDIALMEYIFDMWNFLGST
jgi:hypothetical protein